MGFLVRFTGFWLASFQKHAIDNSMIKKLYSSNVDKKDDDNDSKADDDKEMLKSGE